MKGTHTATFTVDGLDRTYTVHVPTGYDATRAYPVVLGLPGGFGSAGQFERSSGLSALADTRGFIAVYGQGTSWAPLKAPVWNAGGCCGKAVDAEKDVDDVGYATEVIRRVGVAYHVDASRVFATGMSNGSQMANRLACEAADTFSGIAAVSGTPQVEECSPSRQIRVMMIHGTADDNVPYQGGTGSKQINSSVAVPVEDALADWARLNGCTGGPTTTRVPSQAPPGDDDQRTVDELSYQGCSQPTVLFRNNGGVHEWPGGAADASRTPKAPPTKVLDAATVIVDFFGS